MTGEGFTLSREWTARWIWHPHAPVKNAWVLLRREFVMDDVENARLFISADTRYRAWVNGALLGDGPPQSQPYHQYYDEREIAPYLQKGPNCLAVLVHHQGVQDAARGGFLAEVVDGSGTVCCVTDSGSMHDWPLDAEFMLLAYEQNRPFPGARRFAQNAVRLAASRLCGCGVVVGNRNPFSRE